MKYGRLSVALEGKFMLHLHCQTCPYNKSFVQDRTSAESFEKTLSAISTKIAKATVHNDKLRQRSRKLKVGWTLYGGFSYILAVLIFTLVTGWRNWGAMEYTIVSGGPVV
jgi:hypothetical protein